MTSSVNCSIMKKGERKHELKKGRRIKDKRKSKLCFDRNKTSEDKGEG